MESLPIARRLFAFLAVLAAADLYAQPAHLSNARLERRAASGGLEKTIRGATPSGDLAVWIAYAVPAVDGRRHMCCYGSMRDIERSPCAGGCQLEKDGRDTSFFNIDGDDCTPRGGGASFFVFLRAVSGAVERIRAFSEDCRLDAGGLPVVWLTDVNPAESVAMLEHYVGSPDLAWKKKQKRSGEPVLSVLAAHGHPAADAALERLARPPHLEELRKHALFWLGNSRGQRGYEFLRRVARDEPSVEIRRHVTFALSQNSAPEAVPALIRMAREDESAEVRGQALFWLAQKAGEKAADTIEGAIADDPDTEVKKKAVFALTQLPKAEGIPLLIQVARENRNPEVRKQAIFWLGQSRDPRAFEFIRGILEN